MSGGWVSYIRSDIFNIAFFIFIKSLIRLRLARTNSVQPASRGNTERSVTSVSETINWRNKAPYVLKTRQKWHSKWPDVE